MTGDPELEAPSPTFTLMQTYDGPASFPIVHADFYRLRGAEELMQLGWDGDDRGRGDAGRMAGARRRRAAAATGSRSRCASTPRAGADFRRVELRARGAMAARFKRARAIEMLLRARGLGARRVASRCTATPRSAPTSG